METAFAPVELAAVVRAARARTGVPGVAAGLLAGGRVELAAAGTLAAGGGEPVTPATPFRIASLSKAFTAALAVSCLDLDAPLLREASARRLLAHTAGIRPESPEPLPAACAGLWSYSNAGYWAVGEACARACGRPFAEAMHELVLAPLGLGATGYAEPAGAARGHVQAGATGHEPVLRDAYPEARFPSGGLWSTVGDLLAWGEHLLRSAGPLAEPRAEALGAAYGLGLWVRELEGGRRALDHEGSVAGYQSLLLLVPAEGLVLAVLTSSWRGSALIRRVVEALGLVPSNSLLQGGEAGTAAALGRYGLGGREADVEPHGAGLRIAEREVDPVTGAALASPAYRVEHLGGGVYGAAGGLLMSHRLDFPRPGVARVGWVALPRVGPAGSGDGR